MFVNAPTIQEKFLVWGNVFIKNKTKTMGENKRARDDTKEDSTKNSEINKSYHSGTNGETNDSGKKPDHSLEEQDPGHEQTVFRESQHSGRPEDKDVVEQEVSHVDNGFKEEIASSLENENQKHLERSEENIIEEQDFNEEEPDKRGTEEINDDENVIAQFRAHDDSIEENKVTYYNPNGGVYRSKASDDNDDRSPEERSPEDQSSKEKSGKDSNFSKFKPVIRNEGDKLYTYVKAPEYEDYHEKLAKWQQKHPQNPGDFMK